MKNQLISGSKITQIVGFVTYLSIKPKKLNVHNAKVQYAPYVVEKNSIIKMFVIYVT